MGEIYLLHDEYKEVEYEGLFYNYRNNRLPRKRIAEAKSLTITGKAGTGKTYIACALAICALQKFMRKLQNFIRWNKNAGSNVCLSINA